MLAESFAQFRFAVSLIFGVPFDTGSLERLADALRRVERPIPVDPRFAPREAGAVNPARYDRASLPPARADLRVR